ncbi:MAG: hypothetical protein HRS50_00150 [Mycoplasmataceae bacterium]|nr:hypothetical protein [Mycoplasmataceae bacterium]
MINKIFKKQTNNKIIIQSFVYSIIIFFFVTIIMFFTCGFEIGNEYISFDEYVNSREINIGLILKGIAHITEGAFLLSNPNTVPAGTLLILQGISEIQEGLGLIKEIPIWVEYGQAVIYGIFTSIFYVTLTVGSLFIGVAQDIIMLLFDGSFIYESMEITYKEYLSYLSIIFLSVSTLYLFLRFFKMGVKNKKENKLFISIFNSFILIILIPIAIQMIFLTTQYSIEYILGKDMSGLSIIEIIKSFTLINLNGDFFESIFNDFSKSGIINLLYAIEYIVVVWIVFYSLIYFVILLGVRFYQLFIIGVVVFPFVAASSFEDGGVKLEDWTKSLFRKAFYPIIILVFYLSGLVITSIIIESINDWNLILDYAPNEKIFKSFFQSISIVSVFILLKLMCSNLGNFKKDKFEIKNELIELTGNNGKNIQTNINFDKQNNYSFSKGVPLQENKININKNEMKLRENNDKKYSSVNETLEKVKNNHGKNR